MSELPSDSLGADPTSEQTLLDSLRSHLASVNKYVVVVVLFKLSLLIAIVIYANLVHPLLVDSYTDNKHSTERMLFMVFMFAYMIILVLIFLFMYICGVIIGKKGEGLAQTKKAAFFLTIVGLPLAYVVAYGCFIKNKYVMDKLPDEFSTTEKQDGVAFIPTIKYFIWLCGLVAEFGGLFLILYG